MLRSFTILIAAYGELHFVLTGFICQALALCFEASRLVMIEILLHGMKVGHCLLDNSLLKNC